MKLNFLQSNNATLFTYGENFLPVWEHPAALGVRDSNTGLTVWCELPPQISINPVFNTMRDAVWFLRNGIKDLIEEPPETAYYVNTMPLMSWINETPATRKHYLKKVTIAEVEAAIAKATDENTPELSFRELAITATCIRLDCFLTEQAAEKALEYWPFEGFGHSGQIIAAVQRRKLYIPPKEGEYFGRYEPHYRVLVLNRTKKYGYIIDSVPNGLPAIKQILPPGWWDVWTRQEYSAIKKALIDANS